MTRAQRAARAESYRRFAEAVVDAIWPAAKPYVKAALKAPDVRITRRRRAKVAA